MLRFACPIVTHDPWSSPVLFIMTRGGVVELRHCIIANSSNLIRYSEAYSKVGASIRLHQTPLRFTHEVISDVVECV